MARAGEQLSLVVRRSSAVERCDGGDGWPEHAGLAGEFEEGERSIKDGGEAVRRCSFAEVRGEKEKARQGGVLVVVHRRRRCGVG
ncbi:hypothetical protein HAX54_052603 [Datura stramonium]|uniref:Uncharacterized protein n=1 Tax=Datura stramonium TaxID=4076 RepID=A0ABS8WRI5_DATST|nr:hypothetical protein [Datura stramonium]